MGMRIKKSGEKTCSIRCTRCEHLSKDKKAKGYIGVCTKYNRKVIDSLCWCEKHADGSVILHNFGHDQKEEEKETMNNKRLYLAYGSNMSTEQMRHRCPDAKIIGTAEIKDYRLMYKGSKTGAYATIEPEEGQKVPVLVWDISPTDEARLDLYEGFPTFYYKKEIPVEITTLEGDHLGEDTAMVYIMDDRRTHGMPTPHYEGILREGYQRFNFDEEILDEALGYTAMHVYGKKAVK